VFATASSDSSICAVPAPRMPLGIAAQTAPIHFAWTAAVVAAVSSWNADGAGIVSGSATPGHSSSGRLARASDAASSSARRRSEAASEFVVTIPTAFPTIARTVACVSSDTAFWWMELCE
jgi:hypothetical protein